ncbi:low-density lipoprotein receptor-related protein 2-like isoform X3 [Asterias rubens]|uniref:low-density lipoprotein receptor-related protein 2-like isoform X3 n=1 Tax=Asterias rubens TaxID=7604 RepID=UPI00145579D8|nr:low-density lipoprotein receptor-related protein 2-like isoform X3 [Asterias rubens]
MWWFDRVDRATSVKMALHFMVLLLFSFLCKANACDKDTEFRCGSDGQCLPASWQCDGQQDCTDSSDESSCEGLELNCDAETEFECSDGCIPKQWRCDGEEDCKDGSDEASCVELELSCSETEFKCSDNHCIPKHWHCDGDEDCNDGSDEATCSELELSCSETEFKCSDNQCIPKRWHCDGDEDCNDGSDEATCSDVGVELNCNAETEFECSDQCITKTWQCDGDTDCEDGSDEASCPGDQTCSDDEFTCDDGSCQPSSVRCNGFQDCPGNSDEKDCSGVCTAQNRFQCPYQSTCILTSQLCDGTSDCQGGEDETKCTAQACSDDNGGCGSRQCISVPKGYYCDHAPPKLLLVDRTTLRKLNVFSATTELVARGLNTAVAISYDPIMDAVYLTDVGTENISRLSFSDGSSVHTQVVVTDTISNGVAYDWVYRNLYWTDTGDGTINVARWDGSFKKTLINENLKEPRGIVVDPAEGYMFWTDWGSTPHIGRAGLDGQGVVTIVTEDIIWPNGIALDYDEQRIFWIDAKLRRIESSDIDGNNRHVILDTTISHPFDIIVHQDNVYWTDWETDAVSTANKYNGERMEDILDDITDPNGLALMDQQIPLSELTNVCESAGNPCSHLCLRSLSNQQGFVCACPTGTTLASDGESCLCENRGLLMKDGVRCEAPNACEEAGHICSHICLEVPRSVDPAGFRCSCPGDKARLTGSNNSTCVCQDGSLLQPDEISCKAQSECGRRAFQCRESGQCILLSAACDGRQHCKDGSDEDDCDGGCGDWGYQCNNGHCIPKRQRCDGETGDCPEYEDEIGCENVPDRCGTTEPDPCPGVTCVNLQAGLQCVCPYSYALQQDNRTCQFAYPTSPKLLLAAKHLLLEIDTLYLEVKDVQGPWNNLRGLSYGDDGTLFVGDIEVDTIDRYDTTEGSFRQPIIATNRTVVTRPENDTEGLAYDWVNKNLYWVNKKKPASIEVISNNGQFPSKKILKNLGIPRGLAVDPKEAYLYWTDWGSNPMIGKAGLDGSHPIKLVHTDIVWPNGLTLDFQARRVYWVDSKLDKMEYVGFDGDGRRILIQNRPLYMEHPFSIAVHQHLVFWNEWRLNKVSIANKFTGEILHSIPLDVQPFFLSVKEHSEIGEIPNRCLNHGCSHICLPSPSKLSDYICACPPGSLLDWNGKYCLCEKGGRLLKDGISCEPQTGCRRRDFQCRESGECILLSQTCDRHKHCKDGSDEDDCDGGCGDWGFQCNDGKCIHKHQRCDGVTGDCLEYEDEMGCENVLDRCGTTQPDPCPGVTCINLQAGVECICPDRYALQQDKRTCEFAYPTPPKLLLAARHRLLEIDTLLLEFADVQGPWTNAISVTYGEIDDILFVGDNLQETIYRYDTTGGRFRLPVVATNQTLVSGRANDSEGLAYDWVNKNLYWVNTMEPASIDVTSNNGQFPSAKVVKNLDKPRGLAVDPREVYLYWTGWGSDPMIGKAGLDGSNPTKLVHTDLGWPNGLTLDFQARRVYWVDSRLDTVEYVGFDGDGRHILIQDSPKVRHPFGIAVYQHLVFWNDWGTNEVTIANKFTGEILNSIPLDGQAYFMSVMEHQYEIEEIPKRCLNHGCSHICLPSPSKPTDYICACPMETRLDQTKQTCLCENGRRLLEDGISCEPQPECGHRDFQCREIRECILLSQTCDRHQHCKDGSDEDDCDGGCGDWGFQCNDGKCIHKRQRCDGVTGDCLEYEDEMGCENVPDRCGTTQPDPCPGVTCINLQAGVECICPDSYALQQDNRTCEFEYPTPPKLLLSARRRLLEIDTLLLEVAHVQGPWNNIIGVAYGEDGRLFVGDITQDTIERYDTTGGRFRVPVVATNQTLVSGRANDSEGLAYDWVNKNLYWVNTMEPASIDVTSNNGQFPSAKVVKNLDKPRGLAVDPREVYLYWTGWGSNPMIGKAGLDGSNPTKLVHTDLGWPNGLTLDFQARRVYWVDSRLDTVEYVGFDGDGRHILIQDSPKVWHPFGIAVYQHLVFWNDWGPNEVTIANKFTGEILNSIPLDGQTYFMSVMEHQYENEEIPKRCLNHGCSHICLPSPSKPTDYICACPMETRLDQTKQTCLCENGRRLLEDGISCEPQPECGRRDFQCRESRECILLSQTCDRHQHCKDGSDEDDCDGACGDWGFQCNDGKCIHKRQRCDGVTGDCLEYEDEMGCENVPDRCGTTQPDPCPGVTCINLQAGVECICPDSYALQQDNRTCEFEYPTPPKLLLSARRRLLEIDTLLLEVAHVQGPWNNIIGVAYGEDGRLFVGDITQDTIERYSITVHTGQPVIVTNRTLVPQGANHEGLAYDWIHKNLYCVNTEQPASIDVISNNGQFLLTKILKNLDKPRGLAVDPKEAFLYWTDWGENPMIGKAGLDGSRPTKLVHTNLGWVNGLTLDFQARRVYWVDSRLDTVEYVGFYGDGRRILIQDSLQVQHPFSIAVHQHFVIWNDWRTDAVSIANKFTGEILDTIPLDLQAYYMTSIEHQSEIGEVPNRCLNHRCSHICLPSPSRLTDYICACPPGSLLDWDGEYCLCEKGGRLLEDGVSCEARP